MSGSEQRIPPFQKLKEVATKEFKFKQLSCYNNAISNELVNSAYPNIAKANEGFCFPLACRYLRDFTSGSWTGFQKTTGVKGGASTLHMETAEDAAARMVKFMAGSQSVDHFIQQVAASYGLQTKELETLNYRLCTQEATWHRSVGCYLIHMQGIRWQTHADAFHAAAVIVTPAFIRFFDSNIGGYIMPPTAIGNFDELYAAGYFTCGYEWHLFTVYRVSR